MEELIPLILIFVVSSIVSSMKKNQKAAEAQRRHAAAAAARMQAAQPRPQPAPPAAPAPVFTPPASVADVPGQIFAPMVHAHLQPDCNTHDAPGSLGVTSMEGKDPCHEEQLTHARNNDVEALQEGGLTLDWTGENMVKAFVMQEVLARPCARRAR